VVSEGTGNDSQLRRTQKEWSPSKKFIIIHLVDKFPALYDTASSISLCTKIHFWFLLSQVSIATYHPHNLLLEG